MRGDLRGILEWKLTYFGNGMKVEQGVGNKKKRNQRDCLYFCFRHLFHLMKSKLRNIRYLAANPQELLMAKLNNLSNNVENDSIG